MNALDWRRRQLPQLDPGWGILLLLVLLAAWPFLSRAGLPRETDAELHIFRLAELARLVGGGEIYPRWAPNFYFGYGYPIFNYYAPLVYYLGLIPMALGAGAVTAVKIIFVAGLALGAAGTFGFVRARWGTPAALTAAAAFLFAPYVLYVDPHARGDLAESFSLGLLPLCFWAMDALRRQASPARWLAAVAAVAGAILAHNLMAMVTFALLLVWVGLESGAQVREAGWLAAGRRAWPLAAALLIAVGLAAFFWLPVALEQGAVNLANLIGDGSHFDFRNHFLSLGELLAPSPRLDWGATEPDFRLNLGLGQWLLALVGWAAAARRAARTRRSDPAVLFFLVAGLALVLFMLPLSEPVWAAVPLLPFLQFPWRLLGPAAFVLAVPAGWAATALCRLAGRWRGFELALTLGGLLITALPLLAVPPWPAAFGETGTRALIEIEYRGRWLGTTSTADFVPVTVDVVPGANEQVRAGLLAETTVDRVNRATLPAGATVVGEAIRPLYTRYVVDSPEAFALRLFQFDFPGWEASVDGRPVTTELGLPEGFLIVPVPAGRHVVDVRFGSTPPRRAAAGLSAASLVAALGMAVVLGRRREQTILAPGDRVVGRRSRLAPAAATVAAIGLVTIVWLLPAGVLHRQSTGLTALPAATDTYRVLGDEEIALIGYTAPAEATLRPGRPLALTLYWKALRSVPGNYQSFVHLVNAEGAIVAQVDKLNPGDFPTRRWPTDRYVRDPYRLALPSDLPAGSYRLVVGLYLAEEARRLPVSDQAGQVEGDAILLGRWDVEP